MDLTSLENALNNGDFKEQVYRSLDGIYQISKVLNQLDLLENFREYDLEIVGKIQAVKNALAGDEISERELKAKISALMDSLEATKQELEARLNMELTSARVSETQKLNEAGNALKTQLISELKEAKGNLAQSLSPTIATQGVIKFLGIFVYGRQTLFKNDSDQFMELFEFANIHLQANKDYIVQFSMPYEIQTKGIYEEMGEMVLCLKANSKVWPILNSFYQNRTASLNYNNQLIGTYRTTSVFKTPSEQADYKIALFARKFNSLWVNVNYTRNTTGFETSFLNSASFRGSTTQSIPTAYNNDWVFYKHSKAIVYEILK
ncbi:coiled-coil domain-containing protein [Helicobacter pylori]|uniref:coiled-coil domain-containing protein n=1 Tax=Helicobacter pylori TaxID=210 RepID=UPI003570C64F